MKKYSLRYIFILTLIFSLLFSSLAWADDFEKINVKINLNGESGGFKNPNIIGKEFNIWRIKEDIRSYDWEKLIAELNSLNEDELKEYKKLDLLKSNEEGIIELGLSNGIYYIREVDSNSNMHFQPFLLLVSPESANSDGIIEVFPKPISYDTKLVKTSPDGKKLPGAEFELYYWKDDKWTRVPLDGNKYSDKGDPNITLVTDENGEIRLSDLPAGKYRFKETKAPDGYLIKNEFTEFIIKGNSAETTVVEVENYKSVHNFLKVDEGDRPLKDAKFLVTKKVGDFFERVQVNGKDYVISSNENGYFVVENLPYGEYFLWEVEPPLGYSSIANGVPFIIDENSYNKVITIKDKEIPIIPPETPPEIPPEIPPNIPPEIPNIPNIPKVPITEQGITPKVPKPNSGIEIDIPPKKTHIVVPKTGDITLFLLVGGGILLAGLGYSLVRDKDNKDSV